MKTDIKEKVKIRKFTHRNTLSMWSIYVCNSYTQNEQKKQTSAF